LILWKFETTPDEGTIATVQVGSQEFPARKVPRDGRYVLFDTGKPVFLLDIRDKNKLQIVDNGDSWQLNFQTGCLVYSSIDSSEFGEKGIISVQYPDLPEKKPVWYRIKDFASADANVEEFVPSSRVP
jgi:hypothetical protein